MKEKKIVGFMFFAQIVPIFGHCNKWAVFGIWETELVASNLIAAQ